MVILYKINPHALLGSTMNEIGVRMGASRTDEPGDVSFELYRHGKSPKEPSPGSSFKHQFLLSAIFWYRSASSRSARLFLSLLFIQLLLLSTACPSGRSRNSSGYFPFMIRQRPEGLYVGLISVLPEGNGKLPKKRMVSII